MDRLRRLSITFLLLGLLLPLAPHLLGFPSDGGCLGGRIGGGECGFAGLGAVLTAVLLRAYIASRQGDRWQGWLWAGMAFVVADFLLAPLETLFVPRWYWSVFR